MTNTTNQIEIQIVGSGNVKAIYCKSDYIGEIRAEDNKWLDSYNNNAYDNEIAAAQAV
jgi:hypothetical protein